MVASFIDENDKSVIDIGCDHGLLSIYLAEKFNNLKIIQNRLDIFPIVWQNILVDVPLRVLAPDASDEPASGDGWRLITEDTNEEVIDPRLAKLKDYIKE